MHVQPMLDSHPSMKGRAHDALARLPEICFDCAQVCVACADACLGEKKLDDLRQCIRLNQDCADVCATTATVATRRTGSDEKTVALMLVACAEACRVCSVECARHGLTHEHCRICANVCRECEQACLDAIRSLDAH